MDGVLPAGRSCGPVWRNGRRGALKMLCRKTCGFESHHRYGVRAARRVGPPGTGAANSLGSRPPLSEISAGGSSSRPPLPVAGLRDVLDPLHGVEGRTSPPPRSGIGPPRGTAVRDADGTADRQRDDHAQHQPPAQHREHHGSPHRHLSMVTRVERPVRTCPPKSGQTGYATESAGQRSISRSERSRVDGAPDDRLQRCQVEITHGCGGIARGVGSVRRGAVVVDRPCAPEARFAAPYVPAARRCSRPTRGHGRVAATVAGPAVTIGA